MAKKRILILGGGLSGLSVAWYLQKKGIDCQIFEKESEVGGLCRSKKIGGFTFDYDGHLLHFRHNNTLRFIKNLLGNNLVKHKRNAEIFSFERFSRFPFQSNLYGFPKPVIEECLEGFIKAHHDGYRKKKTDSFGDWINRQLGPGIAKHFMIPYNTKFWTILPQKLTCEWVDGFISVPSLEEMIEGTIKESKINLGYNAFFWYPKRGGINEFPLALAGQLKNIFTSCEVTKIDLTNKRIKLANGSEERFDLLLSTLPLPELPFLIKDIPEKINSVFKKLRWNSIFNINLGTEREAGYARHWIYFPEKDFCFFRVGFPHSFSHSIVPKGKGSLYIEVSYSRYKPIDKNNIILHVLRDLRKAGILKANNKILTQDINDIKYGYPICDFNYNEARKKILNYLLKSNIISLGRYGSWRYMSMEDTILDGEVIADRLGK